MKRLTLCLALAVMLLAGCKSEPREFTTHIVSGKQCYLFTFDEAFLPMANCIGEINSYKLEWPDKGVLSSAAERELQYLCFGDSTSTSIEKAASRWLDKAPTFKDMDGVHAHEVDSLADTVLDYSYCTIESLCQQDSALATFVIKSESYAVGAAHGMYSADFLTIDKATGNAVHLVDLVTDTNLLCEAIAHAVQDLEVNKDTRECLFDEFIDVERMPLPRNFTIDSARNNIIVYYGLYEITCYACGIQEVTLPIFWLSKHVPLTPYAKRLFGPDSYIQ